MSREYDAKRDQEIADAISIVLEILCVDTCNNVYNACIRHELPLSLAVCIEAGIGGSADCDPLEPGDDWVTEDLYMTAERNIYLPYHWLNRETAGEFTRTVCERGWWKCLEEAAKHCSDQTWPVMWRVIRNHSSCPDEIQQLFQRLVAEAKRKTSESDAGSKKPKSRA